MQKLCEVCSRSFVAKRAAARFCGATCRKRASRRPEAAKSGPLVAPVERRAADVEALSSPTVTDGVEAATRAELDRAGRLNVPVGQSALVLARRLDDPGSETGTAMANLAKQHAAALTEALKGALVDADPLDELRSRRELKLASG